MSSHRTPGSELFNRAIDCSNRIDRALAEREFQLAHAEGNTFALLIADIYDYCERRGERGERTHALAQGLWNLYSLLLHDLEYALEFEDEEKLEALCQTGVSLCELQNQSSDTADN